MINNNYDAIILDINMPVMNGKEFLKILRNS
jgi:CheY-like chemotaxis protein